MPLKGFLHSYNDLTDLQTLKLLLNISIQLEDANKLKFCANNIFHGLFGIKLLIDLDVNSEILVKFLNLIKDAVDCKMFEINPRAKFNKNEESSLESVFFILF